MKLFPGLFLVPSFFPSLISPPRCSLSLGQVTGSEVALLLWCNGALGWKRWCIWFLKRLEAFSSKLCAPSTHKEENQTIA